ncbi:MAG: hypothetical protein QG594_1257 [Bacteroidota bacterium]|nr:hypothetical protein [Bacteroidota bacterium]
MKKRTLVVCVTLATLVFTNPSLSSFVSFLALEDFGYLDCKDCQIKYRRSQYWLILSVYEAEKELSEFDLTYKTKYIAVLGNFFKISTTTTISQK